MQPQDKRSPSPPEEQEVPSRGTGNRFVRGVKEEVRREGKRANDDLFPSSEVNSLPYKRNKERERCITTPCFLELYHIAGESARSVNDPSAEARGLRSVAAGPSLSSLSS